MNIQDIFSQLGSILSDQNQILRVVLILLLLLFFLFTLVLARQIALLTSMLNQVSFTPVLRMLSYILIFATLLLLIAVILV